MMKKLPPAIILVGFLGLLFGVNSAWSVETGIIVSRTILRLPSFTTPGNPTNIFPQLICADMDTGRILSCPFTYTIVGLKEPPTDLLNNGGHIHSDHPLIEPKDSGALQLILGQLDLRTRFAVQGKTGGSFALLQYTLPQAAGQIITEATITAPPGWVCGFNCFTETMKKWADTIDVGVSRLQPLLRPEEVNPDVDILRNLTDTHPSGSHGTPEAVAALKEIAQEYRALTGNKLSVNDMSLPRGGLFDFRGTWAPPHSTHRQGSDADINRLRVDCNVDKDLKLAVETIAKRRPGVQLVCENELGRPDPNGPFKHIDLD